MGSSQKRFNLTLLMFFSAYMTALVTAIVNAAALYAYAFTPLAMAINVNKIGWQIQHAGYYNNGTQCVNIPNNTTAFLPLCTLTTCNYPIQLSVQRSLLFGTVNMGYYGVENWFYLNESTHSWLDPLKRYNITLSVNQGAVPLLLLTYPTSTPNQKNADNQQTSQNYGSYLTASFSAFQAVAQVPNVIDTNTVTTVSMFDHQTNVSTSFSTSYKLDGYGVADIFYHDGVLMQSNQCADGSSGWEQASESGNYVTGSSPDVGYNSVFVPYIEYSNVYCNRTT